MVVVIALELARQETVPEQLLIDMCAVHPALSFGELVASPGCPAAWSSGLRLGHPSGA